MIFLGVRSTLHSKCMKRLYRFVLFAYLQHFSACWEPGQNINGKAGDGVWSPLGALADSRAGVSSLRGAADGEDDERKQRACYHLHAGSAQCRCKNIPKMSLALHLVDPLRVHNKQCQISLAKEPKISGIFFRKLSSSGRCRRVPPAQGRRSMWRWGCCRTDICSSVVDLEVVFNLRRGWIHVTERPNFLKW